MLKLTEVYKTAVISTAHVTAADSERLPIACFDPLTDRGLNWVHGTQYGWIVRAGMRGNDWKEELREYGISEETISKEGANKRGNSSRLTQSFHFFMFEPIFSPVNALNQPI
ncbi:DUF5983 family protein [Enterobacter hormaechei]|uniref:DUF5983 family protein n=1 Tax=Enterobacter hormaechei TaxID=158836 RepID=UPI002011346D|nr:hypothetical protein [Enterobacter hormaechei]